MENKNGPVWVIADIEAGTAHRVTVQLIGKARELAGKLKTNVEVVILGANLDDSLTAPFFAAGADRIFAGDSSVFSVYNSDTYSEVIADLSRKYQPEIILTGSTDIGRELAPIVAAKLETGITAHCIDLLINQENILEMIIPAYGGLITIVCPEKRPQMATVASGVFEAPELTCRPAGEVLMVSSSPKLYHRIKTVKVVKKLAGTMQLDSAAIVVAGGAGAKDIKGWKLISDLSGALNAGLGSTRPAVDEGWIGIETMIGQSGRMVSPKLYIGVGISGDQQHMVGISGAIIMVAVNNDKNSPIFRQVDYGVVEDCRNFIPILIDTLRNGMKK